MILFGIAINSKGIFLSSALPAEDSPENGEAGEADGDLPPLPPGEAPPPPIIAEPRIYQKEEDKKRLAEETKLKVNFERYA